MKLNKKNVLTLAASASLFIALVDGLPYSYFTFLRFFVCAVTAYLAYLAYEKNKHPMSKVYMDKVLGLKNPATAIFIDTIFSSEWVYIPIAVLFNPLMIIQLSRAQWVPIDLAVGIFLVASLFLFKTGSKSGDES